MTCFSAMIRRFSTAAVRGPALHADRLGGGSRWRPGRPVPAKPADLLVGERVRADPEQLAASEVEEHHDVRLDPDADLTAADNLVDRPAVTQCGSVRLEVGSLGVS